jgi:hypothetical protein
VVTVRRALPTLLAALHVACGGPAPTTTAIITRDAEGLVAELAAPVGPPLSAWSVGQPATLHPAGAAAVDALVVRLLPDGHGGLILHLRPAAPAGLKAGDRVRVHLPAP